MSEVPPSSAQPSGSDDADILLVEDDPQDAELTMVALKECGLVRQVEHMVDGAEALDYLASTGVFAKRRLFKLPRLILLDLGLHKVGGLQVLQQLKTDERTKDIPVVVLTGSRQTVELIESYKLGANSYIIKPTDHKQFTAAVSAVAHYWLVLNEPPPR